MNIIAAADLHMTTARPVNRIDNYVEAVLSKLDQILHLAREHEAVLAIAGDLWDTSKMSKIPYELTNKVIQMIRLSNVTVLACHGQHDMAYHSKNLQVSPYYTLLVGGAIKIPGALGISVGRVRFFGAGWGQDIPMPTDKTPNIIDVLLLHRTITLDDPPFYLENATTAKDTLKALYNFDYIISGDFHMPFWIQEENGRTLVNCGPMMRNSIDLRDFIPRVHLIDTINNKVTPMFLNVEKDVWNDERLEKLQRHEISIDTLELLNVMKEQSAKPDFMKVLDSVLDEIESEELLRSVNLIITIARKNLEKIQ